MIIVTGATGKLGHAIVMRLAQRIPATEIGASCRDPEKAHDLADLGVRVRRGDFSDPGTLADAFEGVTQLLLVSSNARAQGGDPLAQHAAAIDAARIAGATRILYTSQIASSPTSAFPAARDHAATEAMLAENGLAWTALRNGFYAQSGILMMGEALKTGTLETVQDGKFSWVGHQNLAEAAVAILTEEGRFDGPTPPLTGAEGLDFGDMARIASEVTGKTITRTIVTDEEMRAKVMARGAPARAADMVLGLYIAARKGEFAKVDPTLETLIGHAPVSMKDMMARQIGG